MFRKALLTAALLLAPSMSFAQESTDVELETLEQKASYAVGFNIGTDIVNQELNLSLEQLVQGITDAMAKRESKLSDEEALAVIRTMQERIQKREMERITAMAEENLKKGQAFLQANMNKEGVKQLESGLQYKIVSEGTGATPKVTDRVRTHYRGTLIDGTVFDSSYDRGEPVEFAVGGVIRGWTEALQRMKVGDKWILYIPSELAYGPRGAGGDIGPNETLIFEIELLEIVE